jgi:hypothetical protein
MMVRLFISDAARSGGVVFRHFEDLNAVFEFDTCDNLRLGEDIDRYLGQSTAWRQVNFAQRNVSRLGCSACGKRAFKLYFGLGPKTITS